MVTQINNNVLSLKLLEGERTAEIFNFVPDSGLVTFGRYKNSKVKFFDKSLSRI